MSAEGPPGEETAGLGQEVGVPLTGAKSRSSRQWRPKQRGGWCRTAQPTALVSRPQPQHRRCTKAPHAELPEPQGTAVPETRCREEARKDHVGSCRPSPYRQGEASRDGAHRR